MVPQITISFQVTLTFSEPVNDLATVQRHLADALDVQIGEVGIVPCDELAYTRAALIQAVGLPLEPTLLQYEELSAEEVAALRAVRQPSN